MSTCDRPGSRHRRTSDEFINCVRLLGPSFGGINLEDIRPAGLFHHRAALARSDGHPGLSRRPARHRDHRVAGLINALHLTDRNIKTYKLVLQRRRRGGHRLYRTDQIPWRQPENCIALRHASGVIYQGSRQRHEPVEIGPRRSRLRPALWLTQSRTPTVFGLVVSAKGALTPEMLLSMALNPDHLRYGQPGPGDHARKSRAKCAKTRSWRPGRSDYPNQVNNVLGFPYHLPWCARCARATINEEMKIAAA